MSEPYDDPRFRTKYFQDWKYEIRRNEMDDIFDPFVPFMELLDSEREKALDMIFSVLSWNYSWVYWKHCPCPAILSPEVNDFLEKYYDDNICDGDEWD